MIEWRRGNSEGEHRVRDPSLSAYGILTAVEGGRAHFQIYDDVVNTRNAKSPRPPYAGEGEVLHVVPAYAAPALCHGHPRKPVITMKTSTPNSSLSTTVTGSIQTSTRETEMRVHPVPASEED